MRRLGPALFIAAWLLPGFVAGAPWRLAPSPGADGAPRAVVDDDSGGQVSVYRYDDGRVYLEFKSTALGGLSRSSCPTFQIDQRLPQHFYRPGEGCVVQQGTARYALAIIEASKAQSLVLYRLLNGNELAFRYRSQGGTYHEDIFSLSRSKQALLGALGESLTVDPGVDE